MTLGPLRLLAVAVLVLALPACTATATGAPAPGTSSAATSGEPTLGGPLEGFVPELLGQEMSNTEATEPGRPRYDESAAYTSYAERHPGMGVPTVDEVERRLPVEPGHAAR